MLTTIVLAAGESKRFQQYGIKVPKQFTTFGATRHTRADQMWVNVLHNLVTETHVWGVVRADHSQYLRIPNTYEGRNWNVQFLQEATSGQAETLLLGLQMMGSFVEEDLLVVNCDQGFGPDVLDRLIREGRRCNEPAALVFRAFPEEEHRWSYVNSFPYFYDAAEKKAIGDYALAGAYYFPRVGNLVQCLLGALGYTQSFGIEPYISHLYGSMAGAKLAVECKREELFDWGTPQALQEFLIREHSKNS